MFPCLVVEEITLTRFPDMLGALRWTGVIWNVRNYIYWASCSLFIVCFHQKPHVRCYINASAVPADLFFNLHFASCTAHILDCVFPDACFLLWANFFYFLLICSPIKGAQLWYFTLFWPRTKLPLNWRKPENSSFLR